MSKNVPTNCKKHTLDFIYLKDDANQKALIQEIASDLAKVGVTANLKPLEKDAKNTAMQNGQFNMVMSESWGNPYDPHGYLASWKSKNEAHHTVLETLDGNMAADKYATRIDAILSEVDEKKRQTLYTALLDDIHKANIHIPLYGKRIPSYVQPSPLLCSVGGTRESPDFFFFYFSLFIYIHSYTDKPWKTNPNKTKQGRQQTFVRVHARAPAV